jgi:methionine aminotransferase
MLRPLRAVGNMLFRLPDVRVNLYVNVNGRDRTMEIESKLPDVGVTIFTVMSQLAYEKGAINLSQGFPDFDVSPELVDKVTRHMRAGNNQYAPMQGVMALRKAVSEKVVQLYGAAYDPDHEITITAGAN